MPKASRSEGDTAADDVQVSSVERDGVGSWGGAHGVVREASRPYEEDVVEALLATLIGDDFEE